MNYETKTLRNWILNDTERDYDTIQRAAARYADNVKGFREWVEDYYAADIFDRPASVVVDFVMAAFGEVDWDDLLEDMLEDNPYVDDDEEAEE